MSENGGSELAAPPGAPEGARFWRQDDDAHIDVRGLEPPLPMIAVLSWIENPESLDRVLVHLDREPIFLYPELNERAWTYEIVQGKPDEVLLALRPRTE